VKDSTILEVFDFDISVESNLGLKANSGVGGNFNDFIDFKIAFMNVNAE